MAIIVLTDAKLYVAQYDLSGDSNQLELTYGAEEKEVTTFGSGGSVERIGGLRTFGLTGQGYADYGAGEPDTVLFDNLAVSDVLVTAAPNGTDGEVAYFTRSVQGTYQTGTQVGEVMPFSASMWGRGQPLVRGTVMHPDTTARTASGSGTVRQLGAVSATQKLYAALHVVSVSGTTPNLTVRVQSDDLTGFASPTDRITFTAATATTSQWATPVSGAITDTFWRVNWTISGTTPSFRFAVVVGIL